ncbi:hypothetical protein H0H87_007307, partial [Tephrocybe sp. NHM501043]
MAAGRVPPQPPDSLFSGTTKATLLALYQSADAFPPLKSACGAVLAIWDAAERVKGSKKNAQALALRCYDILNTVNAHVIDSSKLSNTMQDSISSFN